MNLVVNARDAMRDGGTIHISTGLIRETKSPGQKLESYVRTRVRDDGMGMPEDVRRKILDPFFTTKAGAGTGLGRSEEHTYELQSLMRNSYAVSHLTHKNQ